VSGRELTVLGTASQVPTRQRAHNALLLRWDDHDLLIDPGEAAQRQLTLAGMSTARITTICITHDHGDHCFGLPGILQRMALDGVDHDVDLYFPSEAAEVVDALVAAAPHASDPVRRHPVDQPRAGRRAPRRQPARSPTAPFSPDAGLAHRRARRLDVGPRAARAGRRARARTGPAAA
jgi:ribonuclease BN (tRNA processing enzyme)